MPSPGICSVVRYRSRNYKNRKFIVLVKNDEADNSDRFVHSSIQSHSVFVTSFSTDNS